MSIWVYTIPDLPWNEIDRLKVLKECDIPRFFNDPLLMEMTADACRTIAVKTAAITLVDEFDVVLIATCGCAPGSYRRSTSLCAHAIIADTRTFVVPDARDDHRFAGNPHVVEDSGVRFYAAAQMVVDPDLVLGTFCVFDDRPRPGLSACEQDQLLSYSAQATSYLRDHRREVSVNLNRTLSTA